ncbi:hypothetical protein [Bacillus arachidis]|uniref:Uncharacterized protein n=1 Tax=Bacillus arachidis TaxID=2819290 RepID=A0ABS3P5R7_9BACI|nr:hypothetical protein [Bacillus arachidis]MBO1628543.1 hypothetical protein [Bacillus arachidis]
MKKLVSLTLAFIFAWSLMGVEPTSAAGNIEKVDKRTTFEELTYEEAMERIANYSGLSIQEVKLKNPNNLQTLGTCGYGEARTQLDVSTFYQPYLVVVVDKCRDGSFGWIGNINYANLLRQDAWGRTKVFSGDVKAWNNDQRGIEYLVNGDFFDYGNMVETYSSGANTTAFSIGYSVSQQRDHFKYWYSGYKYFKIVP